MILRTALAMAALAAPAASAYDRTDLQRDADAIHAAGVTGVVAEARGARDRFAARSGVASLKTRRRVPLDGYFRINSSTKTFVAVVTMQLVGEGRLSLDDPVERWLPDVVHGHGNDGTRVTVRNLLGQTSGVYDYIAALPQSRSFSPAAFRRYRFRTAPPERLVALAMRHKPRFAPGAKWSYSNTNYILAGMIVEKVTGHPWQREIRDRIIRPLHLRHTPTPDSSPFLPRPHAQAYQQFRPGGPLVDTTTVADRYADGGIVSTTGDMNRFVRGLVGGRLLGPAQLAEMQGSTSLARAWWDFEPGARYGLGIAWRPLPCGGRIWYHGGDGMGISNFEAVSPDGRRSVVLAMSTQQVDRKPATRQRRAAVRLVDRAMCGLAR